MVEGITVVGVIEGDGPVLAATTLEIEEARHERKHGNRFVLRLDDERRVTVAATGKLAVVPAKPRRGTWRDVASDPRAALFADVAPGDHVDVKLLGWVLVPGQRVVVRGTVADEELSGGGPREAAVAQPSVIDSKRVAIVTTDDAAAISLLDEEEAHERREQQAKRARQAAAEAAQRGKTPRPLQRFIIELIVFAIILVVTGLACWRGVAAATAGRNTSGVALLSITSFVIAYYAIAMLLVCLVVRPPFEAARCGEAEGTISPPWNNIPLLGGFFLLGGAIMTASVLISVAFDGLEVLAFPVALCALGSFFFLWWGSAKHRAHRQLARLLGRARVLPDPVEGQFGLFVGRVAPGSGWVIDRSITWQRHKYTNQSTHGPNAGQTSRWTDGTPSSSSDPSFTVHCGSTKFVVETANAQWGAPLSYEPGTMISTRARIANRDEILVLARLRNENGTLVARSTGPESLVLFGAPQHARATLRRLAWRWLLPARALAALILASIAAIVWLAS
ncbi:MAG TPA: hypothetical protein VFV99_30625 [Kofleriaceae bacterium]|nr:hypothetical protein [Kofleriaceae bacterium]